MTKSNLVGERFGHPGKSEQELKQGRNLEAGADAEAMAYSACFLIAFRTICLGRHCT